MKKLLSWWPSSRSFTRSLSIMAIAVVAFAALELVAAQQALALKCCACTSPVVNGSCSTGNTSNCICDPSSACSITKFSTVSQKTEKFLFTPKVNGLPISCTNTSANTTLSNLRSEINCTGISESTFLEPTSLQRVGTANCTVSEHQSGCVTGGEAGCQAICLINLTYLQDSPGAQNDLSTCVSNTGGPGTADDTSTRTYSGSCSDAVTGKLDVTGTITCPAFLNNNVLPTFCEGNLPCELKLGIAGLTSGQCDDPGFFAETNGQVLSFSQTVSGLACSTQTQVLAQSSLTTLFCSGGSFDGAAADCITGQNQNLVGGGTATAAVPFDVTFTPKSLNLNCGVNNNDTWHFTITGNENLHVANIDVTTSP